MQHPIAVGNVLNSQRVCSLAGDDLKKTSEPERIDMLVAQMDAISGKFKEVDVQLEQLRKSVKVLENTIADIQRKLATKR